MKLVLLVLLVGCSGSEAAPKQSKDENVKIPERRLPIEPVTSLCVTKGAAPIGSTVTAPTMRAIANSSSGDEAALTFKYAGDTETVRELAGGQARRQIGLKLRARDGCNLIYVMWRLDPKPMLDVSVKINPGKRTHKECGTDGYTKVKPAKGKLPGVPVLAIGDTRTLSARIADGELTVRIDGLISWRGKLPRAAADLDGHVGIRSDNLAFDLVKLEAYDDAMPSECVAADGD
ncbi:MAG: hypothetical protein WKG01_31160 [Kofleriaceae bacterium]